MPNSEKQAGRFNNGLQVISLVLAVCVVPLFGWIRSVDIGLAHARLEVQALEESLDRVVADLEQAESHAERKAEKISANKETLIRMEGKLDMLTSKLDTLRSALFGRSSRVRH